MQYVIFLILFLTYSAAGGGLRRQQKHIRAVSEANLLDMEHHHRPRSRGAMHQQQQQVSRFHGKM